MASLPRHSSSPARRSRNRRSKRAASRQISTNSNNNSSSTGNPATMSASWRRWRRRRKPISKQRAGEVARPALVLDIDETSLSNWPRIVADDFGYIPSGTCNRLPKGPCGSLGVGTKGDGARHPTDAEAVQRRAGERRRRFLHHRARRSERAATIRNLRRAGYRGWTKLIMKPVGLKREIRRRFQGAGAGEDCGGRLHDHRQYGRPAERSRRRQPRRSAQRQFLLPNPFYRIP